MEHVDINQLPEKYKDKKALYYLTSGEEVVGQIVDENNRLIYIIRNNDEYRVSYAEDEEPDRRLSVVNKHVITLKG